MSRIMLPAFAVLTLLSASLSVNGQGLKEAAARQKIEAEKLTRLVTDAIDRSFKQDPADAKASLRQMVAQVNDSQDLLPSERASLGQRLQSRIRAVDEAARGKTVTQGQKPPYRDPETPKYKPPVNDPKSGVSGVAQRYTDQGKTTLQTQADLIRQREESINRVNLGIERSFVPTDKEFTFPADWKERSARYKKLFGPQMTEKEMKVVKTLNSVMSVKYEGEKLKAVITSLQDKTGLTILVDQASLEELNIDYEGQVDFQVDKASVRTILKKVLGDKGLTYIIKGGNIHAMTPKKASEYTVIRSYDISDLVAPDPQLAQMFGPFAAQQQMTQNAQMVINMIQQVIEPNYWQPNGPGTITFFAPTRQIIIRASAEMHFELASPGMFGGR